MSAAVEAQIAAALMGVLVTVLWRLIDRYLPDPNNPHPELTATPAEPQRPKGGGRLA